MSAAPPKPGLAPIAEHPYETIIENRPSSRRAGPLRVVAFNAQGGAKFDGIVTCLEREPLAGAAVILLTEVDFAMRRSGRRKVAIELAERLGMSCAYAGEFGLHRGDRVVRAYLGNAILSREPLEDVFIIPLPKMLGVNLMLNARIGGLRRIGGPAAIVATTRPDGKPLRICVAHLDSRCDPGGREQQMKALLERFPTDGPAIIGGDLNTTTVEIANPRAATIVLSKMLLNSRRFRWPIPYEPLFRSLAEHRFEVRGANVEGKATFTFSRMIPPLLRPHLDWIALRGLRPIAETAAVIPARAGFFSRRLSDHDFILVDVAV